MVDDKHVYCLLDVLGVHDELIWAYHRTLLNATGKRDWARAAACSCEYLTLGDKTKPDFTCSVKNQGSTNGAFKNAKNF